MAECIRTNGGLSEISVLRIETGMIFSKNCQFTRDTIDDFSFIVH